MASPRNSRRVSDSLVTMTEIVLPEDTNHRGSAFGGRVLALIDKCAAVVAIRHSRHETVTAALDSVVFVTKVRLGDILLLNGRINSAFESSMEIEVAVRSENPHSGERRLTTTAFVTMVAIDNAGRPSPVPELELSSDEERERAAQANQRRTRRLQERASRSTTT